MQHPTLKSVCGGFIHAALSWLKRPGPWAKLTLGHTLTLRGLRRLAKSETLADLGEADVSRGRRLANEATDELRDGK